MMEIGLIICILVLLILGAVSCVLWLKKDKVYDSISFREAIDLTGNPIVVFYNNGKKFNFLLDTGANTSMIDSTVLKDCKYEKNDTKMTNMGIDGKVTVLSGITMSLYYKKRNYKEDFLVRDLTQPFVEMKKSTGVTLHGILGTTFFTNYDYILDFQELVAYSKKKL